MQQPTLQATLQLTHLKLVKAHDTGEDVTPLYNQLATFTSALEHSAVIQATPLKTQAEILQLMGQARREFFTRETRMVTREDRKAYNLLVGHLQSLLS